RGPLPASVHRPRGSGATAGWRRCLRTIWASKLMLNRRGNPDARTRRQGFHAVAPLSITAVASAGGASMPQRCTRTPVAPSTRMGAMSAANSPVANYPGELEGKLTLRDGAAVRIRPIRPDDAPRLQALHDPPSFTTA